MAINCKLISFLLSVSDIETLASPESDMENEQDSLHAFSGDDTLENSDSDSATIDYDDGDDQADDGILNPALSTPSPVKKARGRPRKNIQLNIIDARGKVCNNELSKRSDDTLENSDSDSANTDDVDDNDEVKPEREGKVQSARQTVKKLEEDVDPDWSPVYKYKTVKKKEQISNNIGENSNIDQEKKKRNRKDRKRPPKEIYTCEKCGESLSGKVALKRHHRDEHTHEYPKQSEGPFTCDMCGEVYEQYNDMRRHQRNSHQARKELQVEKSRRPYHRRSEGPFTCELCGKVYELYNQMRRHQRRSHQAKRKERNFLCDTCGKAFSNSRSLSNHVVMHTGQKFPCLHCHKEMPSAWSLHLHTKRRHTRVEAHICPICNKSVSDRSGLRYHMAKQHGDDSNSLGSNISYQHCDQCDKKYCSQSDLKKHQLAVHAGQRWTCGLCGRVYNYKNAYDKHMRSDHAPPGTKFICEPCGLEFDKGGGLEHHQRRRCPHFQNIRQKRFNKAHVIVQTNPATMETTVVTQPSANQSATVPMTETANPANQSLDTDINIDSFTNQ